MATFESCKDDLSKYERIISAHQVFSAQEEVKVRLPVFETPCIHIESFLPGKAVARRLKYALDFRNTPRPSETGGLGRLEPPNNLHLCVKNTQKN